MNKLYYPDFGLNSLELYKCLVNNLKNGNSIKQPLINNDHHFGEAYDQFNQRLDPFELFEIQDCNRANKDEILAGLLKEDIKGLYEKFRTSSVTKKFYNSLIIKVTDNCPYCGYGEVFHLDHYLPRTYYPFLSIKLENLIPSCAVCNTKKLDPRYVVEGDQHIHPFYDDHLLDVSWLKANLTDLESSGAIEFCIDGQGVIDEVNLSRLSSHFMLFDLKRRLEKKAKSKLDKFLKKLDVDKDHIEFMSKSEVKSYQDEGENHYLKVMFEMLTGKTDELYELIRNN